MFNREVSNEPFFKQIESLPLTPTGMEVNSHAA